jgi:hypothetical protein
MGGRELLEAIRRGEGRTMMCEVLCSAAPLVDGVSNASLAVAFGADLVLLNMFDGEASDLTRLKRLLGRPVGVNIEPSETVPPNRRADEENLERLRDADFLVITANPDVEVDADEFAQAVMLARKSTPAMPIFAGKMHGSGGRGMSTPEEAKQLAGVADAVLVPAPGTVPGSLEARVAEVVESIQSSGALAVATIGTSQEGADAETVRGISLAAKRCGADVLHLGDAGASGIADPQNIFASSLAVRGRRHTYRRMAMN